MAAATTCSGESAFASAAPCWILRIGLIACYIGHGALGLIRMASWTSYFGVVGIEPQHALALMPWVGAFDVAMAFAVWFYPTRAVVGYMAAWSLWTALLRPLAGESCWEMLERAGNYGVPCALFLLFADGGTAKAWFRNRFSDTLDAVLARRIAWVLRLTTVLLLFGHGALNLIVQKPMFSAQYAMICLPGATAEPLIGGFECLLAFAVLLKPTRALLFGVVGWKLATEALCPMAGASFWVFVEHGGSYAAPLALAFLLPQFRFLHDSAAGQPARAL